MGWGLGVSSRGRKSSSNTSVNTHRVRWWGTRSEDECPRPSLVNKNGSSGDDGRRRALVNGHFDRPSSAEAAVKEHEELDEVLS